MDRQHIIDQAAQAKPSSEDELRKECARLFQLIDYFGLSDIIFTHVTCRVPKHDALLINPFGLLFSEVEPYNLVKIGFSGKILADSNFPINKNGATLHCAVYQARSDIQCIIHTHSKYAVIASSLANEIELIDQISMMFYQQISYHDFESLFIQDNQQQQLISDLGTSHNMILKNHGMLSAGNSIAQAFFNAYHLHYACEIYVKALMTGKKLATPSHQAKYKTAKQYEAWNQAEHGYPGNADLFYAAAKRKAQIDF